MYYTNVDLYANLKQLHGLCRQEFYKCSPGSLPHSCQWRGRGLAGGDTTPTPPPPPHAEPPGGGGGVPAQSPSHLPPSSRSLLSLACEPQDWASQGRTQTASGSTGHGEFSRFHPGPMIPAHPFPKAQPWLEGEDGSQNPRESQTC